MSGFEVVGVVLGSIPLLVTALKQYSDGISTVKNMKNYENVFESLHASFVLSLSIYRNSCEQLLHPLMLPGSKRHELLERPEQNAWQDAELNTILRQRLGLHYGDYKASVKQLAKKIVLFGKKLKLGDEMRPLWITDSQTVDFELRQKFFKNPWTRIKGGFDSDRFARLLAEITSDINQIAALTGGALTLEPLRLERARRANTSYWISIRDQARDLFETFSSRWSCNCLCKHPHRANLRLDMRTGNVAEITQNEHEYRNSGARFRFVFSFDPNKTVAVPQPWDWRVVEITPLQSSSTPATTTPSTRHSFMNSRHIPPTPSFTSYQFSPSFSSCVDPPSPNATKIADLCQVLTPKTQDKCCLGFLDDQPWHHYIYSFPAPSLEAEARKSASLHEILYRGKTTSLAIRDKCNVALTLASAVLQLHDTPWLGKSWDLKDIYYINGNNENNNNKNQGTALFSELYVSKSFASVSNSQQPASLQPRCFIRNEMVFALGVALLELSYGEPLSSFKTPQDLDDNGNETPCTEAFIAHRLADTINNRELHNYAKATLRCIRCVFDCFSSSLNDDDFRESFYQGVIVPLQKDYDYARANTFHDLN